MDHGPSQSEEAKEERNKVFASWLLQTFGLGVLAKGGVVDVAVSRHVTTCTGAPTQNMNRACAALRRMGSNVRLTRAPATTCGDAGVVRVAEASSQRSSCYRAKTESNARLSNHARWATTCPASITWRWNSTQRLWCVRMLACNTGFAARGAARCVLSG